MYRQLPKVVSDPISGIIDIAPVLPIVETRAFQALAGKCQLGMTSWVFRAAHHTRFEHCLGAFAATQKRVTRWKQQGYLDKEAGDALSAYALLHDVGHPPFSHVTEDFCELDDDEMTLKLVRGELRSAIDRAGINSAFVEAFAARTNSLYLGVHDKNLGTEKLDYLERDGFYTGMGCPPGIEYLREYVHFIDGVVAIDEKVIDHAADVQTFYMKMYKEVYLRKSLVIAQRMFHKAVYHLLHSGELQAEHLPHMVDAELVGQLYGSMHPLVQRFYQALRERTLFAEGLSLRPESSARETRVADKKICVIGLPQDDMNRLVHAPILQKKNHADLERLEEAIADVIGIPRDSVLVVPVFNPERFEPKDVKIYANDGKLQSLRDRRPDHYRRMEELARSYVALRICTPKEHRATLCSAGHKVHELILSML